MIELANTPATAKTKAQQIRDYVAAHPNATPTEIAKEMGGADWLRKIMRARPLAYYEVFERPKDDNRN